MGRKIAINLSRPPWSDDTKNLGRFKKKAGAYHNSCFFVLVILPKLMRKTIHQNIIHTSFSDRSPMVVGFQKIA